MALGTIVQGDLQPELLLREDGLFFLHMPFPCKRPTRGNPYAAGVDAPESMWTRSPRRCKYSTVAVASGRSSSANVSNPPNLPCTLMHTCSKQEIQSQYLQGPCLECASSQLLLSVK